MIPFNWLEQARQRIAPFIVQTPFSYDARRDLYLKWENHQVTGSFKARGALNKILSLQDWELEKGLVTASAGNHGQGVALAGSIRKTPIRVFASEHASHNKIEAMKRLGAEIVLVAGGYAQAEAAAIANSQASGATWISPYNDGLVIAGQGTIALEVLPELPNPGEITWVVPAGGGGLVSGIGSAVKEKYPHSTLVAVQSDASAFLHSLYQHGTQAGIVELPSIADGLAGAVEEGSVTIPMVRELVDDFVLVSEADIREAIKFAWEVYHERIEGSSAAALAAVLTGQVTSRPAVVILSGGNIEPANHDQIVRSSHPAQFAE